MGNKKDFVHVRLRPELLAWVDHIARRRGESRSEILNYLLERTQKRDETYFPRHAAVQTFLSAGLSMRVMELLLEITDKQPDRHAARARAGAETAEEMQALMRAAFVLFGPAPRVQDSNWAGNDEAADATMAALVAVYRGVRK